MSQAFLLQYSYFKLIILSILDLNCIVKAVWISNELEIIRFWFCFVITSVSLSHNTNVKLLSCESGALNFKVRR